jgi:hypothetical protein
VIDALHFCDAVQVTVTTMLRDVSNAGKKNFSTIYKKATFYEFSTIEIHSYLIETFEATILTYPVSVKIFSSPKTPLYEFVLNLSEGLSGHCFYCCHYYLRMPKARP